MDLNVKQMGQLLKLNEKYIVIDKAIYDPSYPNDLKALKLLTKDDIDFKSHIPEYFIYPDYAIGKILNQGIRLLICLLYPDLNGIPAAMIEHIKLRAQLYPNDQMNIFIKKWQDRSKIVRFEIGIENQKKMVVYESTIYGTLIKKQKTKGVQNGANLTGQVKLLKGNSTSTIKAIGLIVESDDANMFGGAMIMPPVIMIQSIDQELSNSGYIEQGDFIAYVGKNGLPAPKKMSSLTDSARLDVVRAVYPNDKWTCCVRIMEMTRYNVIVVFFR